MMSTIAVMCGSRMRLPGFYRIDGPLVMPCQAGHAVVQNPAITLDGKPQITARPPGPGSRLARQRGARPRGEPAARHELRRPLHGAGIHDTLPDHRPAG